MQKDIQLSHISNIAQILEKDNVNGSISLTCENGMFYFNWIPYDSSPQYLVNSIFKKVGNESTGLNNGKTFKTDFRQISQFRISENDEDLILTIDFNNASASRFSLPKDNIVEVSNFIEALLSNRIVVPNHYKEVKHTLTVYKNCNQNYLLPYPTYIHLRIYKYNNLDDFWLQITEFFINLMTEIAKDYIILQDPAFPIEIATLSSQYIIEQQTKTL